MSVSEALNRIYTNLRGRLIVPHQTDGVRWMLERELFEGVKGGIVADEMGLGKTIQAIAVCLGNPLPNPTLILAPKSLVEQWCRECEKFTGIRPLLVKKKDLTRLSPGDFVGTPFIVTTYESLRHKGPLNALMMCHFGRIILDEAHVIKNSRTQLYGLVTQLRSHVKWCLTGTPISCKKKDLKTLVGFLGAGDIEYKDMRQYVMRRVFKDLCANCERLRLPPLRLNNHVVSFETQEEKDLYMDIADEVGLRIRAMENDVEGEDDGCILETLMRLRQATVNPELVYEGRKMGVWNGNVTKINELVRLISEQPRGSKTLIFTHWHTEANAILDALDARLGLTAHRLYGGMSMEARDSVVKAFQDDPSVAALVLHIDVGGVGLNLQTATHVYINSLDWNATNELQAIARAHRLGVDHVVHATRLVMAGTVDEFILNMQQNKLNYAAEVLGDERLRDSLDISNIRDLKKISEFLQYNFD